MIASRARAMTLLGAAFAIGLIVGGGGIVAAARAGTVNWLGRGRGPGRSNPGYGVNLDHRLNFKLAPADPRQHHRRLVPAAGGHGLHPAARFARRWIHSSS